MEKIMPAEDRDPSASDQLIETWIEVAVRLGVLSLLLYWSFTLIEPFLTIAIWSIMITVALSPAYEWLVTQVGGRRHLAAILFTIVNLLIVIGPITWLVVDLIGSIQSLAARFDPSVLTLPPPPEGIKSWPIVGEQIYKFWHLASTNLQAALIAILPQLKPLGSALLEITTEAGTGLIKFFLAIVVAGFLYSPAPALADAARQLSLRVASTRGDEFARLATATIRNVSRGVVGISALQALLAGFGLLAAGVPAASTITFAILILGIIQIGPSVAIVPLVIWSWFAMDTTSAVLFTAYMIPVGLVDNVLRPLVMGRGLSTPMLVILLGVIGGTITHGITGLFLGPIVLAVVWELLVAWLKRRERPVATPHSDAADPR